LWLVRCGRKQRLTVEFGLTPFARTRLAAGGYAPSSFGKFEGLLK
jgi:hypothetical protein